MKKTIERILGDASSRTRAQVETAALAHAAYDPWGDETATVNAAN